MDTTEYLKQFEINGREDFLARAKALPERLAHLVRAPVLGIKDRQEEERLKEELIDVLHTSDEQTRQALAEAFFPHFATPARRTLEALLTVHPYPQGYARRAFRAPGSRKHAEKAHHWLWACWQATKDYPHDLEWLAIHAGLMSSSYGQPIGLLLGQAISDGDEAVFQILRDTASTQHPIARMGRHVPQALLSSTRPDAWELAEKLLLAAQRQEGLRQVILETVDEASLDAFVRMLRLILQENLLRFAATLRAACVWFGLNYDVEQLKTVKQLLTQALGYLEDKETARQAVQTGSGVEAYLAFSCLGMRDALATAELARPLLRDPDPERRMAAAQFLTAAALLSEEDKAVLLQDADVRLAHLGVGYINRWAKDTEYGFTFEQYLAYAQRLYKEPQHEPLLFPWLGRIPSQADAMNNLPAVLGKDEPISKVQPYLAQMDSYGRSFVIRKIKDKCEQDSQESPHSILDAHTRDLLLTLLQDRNSGVSQEAVQVMAHQGVSLNPQDIPILHGLLKRKAADLRRGIIRLLTKDKEQGSASALELLSGSNTEQRQAGLQLLLEVQGTPPEGFKPKNISEETLYGQLTSPESQVTLKNGLGLFDPEALTKAQPIQPRDRDFPKDLQRGAELLRSLDALIQANRETPLTGMGYDGKETVLLGNASPWMLNPERQHGQMPLAELWDGWWTARPDPQDGDLTRMRWAMNHHVARKNTTETELQDELAQKAQPLDAKTLELLGWEEGELAKHDERTEDEKESYQDTLDGAKIKQALRERTVYRAMGPLVTLLMEHRRLVDEVLKYLFGKFKIEMDTEMFLDAWETILSYYPKNIKCIKMSNHSYNEPRSILNEWCIRIFDESWSHTHIRRFANLLLYTKRSFPKLAQGQLSDRNLVASSVFLKKIYDDGIINTADLLYELIGYPNERRGSFNELTQYTRRKIHEGLVLANHPDWMRAVEQVRERVLEVELTRGDLETPATKPALALQSITGAAITLRLLAGLGKNPLKRGHGWGNTSKDTTFSHLIRVSFPAEQDNPQRFAQQVKDFGIKEHRLLDLAMFAPQWANLVSQTVGWSGLQDGVFWLHAHTKDGQWSVPQEIREAWEAEISERTPLSADELTEGAVDVAWFKQMHQALGPAHFKTLLEAAKYASSSGGHKRAELFASAILGELAEQDLRTRIAEKRNQDAVRAIGLLPLNKAKAKAAKELEGRYRLLSDFKRESKQFGAQKQASERLAADIGMQNLARTAGYADPQRLMWALEARMAPDWQQQIEVEGVQLSIALGTDQEASLVIKRDEKPLKALPAALKKHPEVVAIKNAVTELNATKKRMWAALEEAMVRGDHFQNDEFLQLAQHPVIAPMLHSLLWVLNEQTVGWWRGQTLQRLDGEEAIGEQALRLAHPHDLYLSQRWPQFQQQLMTEGITQPFKQAFREYYPLTNAEQDALRSQRYAGHHVQPGKAAALFKARGWVTVPDEGVRKTFHREGINVWVETYLGYGTPNEVEGIPINAVYFIRRDEHELMPLAQVPPRLFSETMRDLDLVVSVAHVGGVDPEASQSTVEMRTDLLRETLRLLKLDNVRLENNHALIKGHYAQYTVQLGSGTVHRMPGGFLCVVPVHNQHQGRLFLPFADPDPKTAEVISKVLLLAEDKKIQDPTILEQLR